MVLNIANSLWMREGKEFDPDFVERNMNYYNAAARELDFNEQGAVDTINSWVQERTDGQIEEIVEYPIDPLTMLFLVNAVYFQGDWSEPFDAEETREDIFHAPEEEIEDVPFMNQSGDFDYLEKEDEFQAVRLPYGEEERLAMYVFLPSNQSSLSELLSSLDAEQWDKWRGQFEKVEGKLAIPKFTLEYEKTLNEILEKMGMEVAFNAQRADFYDMLARDEGQRLFISEVKHKSFIEVDEKGTEAAAASSVEMKLESMPVVEFEMNVNRPFYFHIHDRETNEVLFNGTLVDPTEE